MHERTDGWMVFPVPPFSLFNVTTRQYTPSLKHLFYFHKVEHIQYDSKLKYVDGQILRCIIKTHNVFLFCRVNFAVSVNACACVKCTKVRSRCLNEIKSALSHLSGTLNKKKWFALRHHISERFRGNSTKARPFRCRHVCLTIDWLEKKKQLCQGSQHHPVNAPGNKRRGRMEVTKTK